MTSATVRDLRTRFPQIKRLLEEEKEVLITDHGRPVAVLRVVEGRPSSAPAIDYYARLVRRMPKAIRAKVRRELDEADRGER
jgi:antitoxin (DNA-binding transcriptional repressor) of toxin-antitoxin stability system